MREKGRTPIIHVHTCLLSVLMSICSLRLNYICTGEFLWLKKRDNGQIYIDNRKAITLPLSCSVCILSDVFRFVAISSMLNSIVGVHAVRQAFIASTRTKGEENRIDRSIFSSRAVKKIITRASTREQQLSTKEEREKKSKRTI